MKVNLGNLSLSSPAFAHGTRIPDRFTAAGDAASPPLVFSAIPPSAVSLALTCDDPDAPLVHGFSHWVVYNIPAITTGFEENGGGSFTDGSNGAGQTGWRAPAAPPGHGEHHYFFHLYALDADLDLAPGLTRLQVLDRIADHVIEQARLVGVFSR